MQTTNHNEFHESNDQTSENRKKVFALLDGITEKEIKPFQSYRPDDFDLSKSVIEFKNLLNSGKLLRRWRKTSKKHLQYGYELIKQGCFINS